MSAFGISPFGTLGSFGGPGLITIITMVAIGTNEVIVFFDRPPRAEDPLGLSDVLNRRKWAIEAVDPREEIDGELVTPPGARMPTKSPWIGEVFVDDLDPTQIHLRTVPALEARISYDVTLTGVIRGGSCEDFAGFDTFRVGAVTPSTRPTEPRFRVATDGLEDIANPYFTRDIFGQAVATPRVWQYVGDDIVHDTAEESLRKRVLRRLLSVAGSWSLYPSVGLAHYNKRRITSGTLNEIAARVREQLLEEPDVVRATVVGRIRRSTSKPGAIVEYEVDVQQRGGQQVTMLFQPQSALGEF